MAKKNVGYDFLAKIIVVGDSGVGKTNILLNYCENSFNATHMATIGIDFKTKDVEIDGTLIRMQIWDSAGQQRFRNITQTYYKGAVVVDKRSFDNVQMWLKQIKSHASEGIVKLLVANKCDCPSRVISVEEGKQLAQKHGLEIYQTSAKDGTNIPETFHCLLKGIKQKFLTGSKEGMSSRPSSTQPVKLVSQPSKQKKKKKCC